MIQIYGCTSGKEPTCQCRHKRLRFNPWVGKIPCGRGGNSLQYSCLGNPMDRGSMVGYSPRGCKTVGCDLLTEQKLYTHTHIYTYISICIGVSSSDALFSFCPQSFPASGRDEMDLWHHWCNGHELGQTPGAGEGQGSLLCVSSWDGKEGDMLSDWTTTL